MSVECEKIKTITQGEHAVLTAIIKEDGADKDLTGVTEIQAVFQNSTKGFINKKLERTGVAEVTTITTVADVSKSLASKSFRYNTPENSYRFYAVVGGTGSDPSGSGETGVPFTFADDATAGDVATALQSAMDAKSDINASVLGSVVTATNATDGSVDNASDVNSGFTITTTTEGVTEITDSVTILTGTSKVEIILTKDETKLLKVGPRQTLYLAIDFPDPINRKIFKFEDAYNVCELSIDLE